MSEFEWTEVEGAQIDELIIDQLFGKRTPSWLDRSAQKNTIAVSGNTDAEIFQQILNIKQEANSQGLGW